MASTMISKRNVAKLRAAIGAIQRRPSPGPDPGGWGHATAEWLRLLKAANDELEGTLDDLGKIAKASPDAGRGFDQLPVSSRPGYCLEFLAVSKLTAIADRAFALAAGLDELLEPYLENRDSLLEDLDEGDPDQDSGYDETEAVTPDGFLTVETTDGPDESGVVRTWSPDLDAEHVAM